MEELPVSSPKGEREGHSFGTALFLVLVLAILVVAGLAAALYYVRGEQRKTQEKLAALELQTKKAEVERKAGAEKDRRVRAENSQQDLLRQARAATNSLENLLAEIKELNAGATALRSNEDGKRVALHPELIERARVFYEVQLRDAPAAADVITRLEGARRIEQQVLSQQGTAYEPAPDLVESARTVAANAEQDRGKVAQLRAYLTALVQESKIKYTEAKLTTSSPILEDAIKAKVTAEAAITQQALADRTAGAKEDANRTRQEAEVRKIKEEAKRDAERKEMEIAELKAALERERGQAEADRKKKDAEAEDKRLKELAEADKIELRRKLSDTNVLATLAPFTTPGYWQIKGTSADLKPISFTKLKASGALEKTAAGRKTLALLVSTSTDKVRPRWKINPEYYTRYPDAVARVTQLQDLLIELGPLLVEMKLLDP